MFYLIMTGPPSYFIDVLNADLSKRKQKNPRYSLRAYARFLGLDPSTLSRILAGKQPPSITVVRKLLRKLGLSPLENRKLVTSVAEDAKARIEALLSTVE
jgi:transcriptional regulator with XRE-family HTH domain